MKTGRIQKSKRIEIAAGEGTTYEQKDRSHDTKGGLERAGNKVPKKQERPGTVERGNGDPIGKVLTQDLYAVSLWQLLKFRGYDLRLDEGKGGGSSRWKEIGLNNPLLPGIPSGVRRGRGGSRGGGGGERGGRGKGPIV